jgi:hypothetical protein
MRDPDIKAVRIEDSGTKAAKHNSNLSKTAKMALLSPEMSSDQVETQFFSKIQAE